MPILKLVIRRVDSKLSLRHFGRIVECDRRANARTRGDAPLPQLGQDICITNGMPKLCKIAERTAYRIRHEGSNSVSLRYGVFTRSSKRLALARVF